MLSCRYQLDSDSGSHNDQACLAPGDEAILHTAASLLGIDTCQLEKVGLLPEYTLLHCTAVLFILFGLVL